jgi:hypothetical protein
MKMKQNVGSLDRKARMLLGAVAGVVSLAILANAVSLPEIASPVLGLVAIIMIGTSVTGNCPIYSLLGVQTCPVSSQ